MNFHVAKCLSPRMKALWCRCLASDLNREELGRINELRRKLKQFQSETKI